MKPKPQSAPDTEPVHTESDLSQTVTRDGQSVYVCIYGTDPHEWTLAIVSAVNCSQIWTEPFTTAQAALDEALKAINEEGIQAFTRPQFEGV